MLKNYLFVTIRHFQKQKFVSSVNILGLTIAIITSVFILLFVFDELQYDNFHEHKDNICRALILDKETGDKNAIFPAVTFSRYIDNLPEIEKGFRLNRDPQTLVTIKNKKFLDDVYYADKEILDILSFPLLYGNKKNALNEPFSAILTEDMAVKHFGQKNPIGQTLILENKHEIKITGVLKNIPLHSHIKLEIIVSIQTLNITRPNTMEKEYISGSYFYFQLKKNISAGLLEEKFNNLVKNYNGDKYTNRTKIILEPLSEIYLYSYDTKWDIAKHGDIDTVIVFISVTVLIMIMASFNFTNLFTTLIKVREKEYAVRKLLGSGRKNIFSQFFFEALFYLLISSVLAFISVELLMDKFNTITDKQISFQSLFQFEIVFSLVGLLLATLVLSILYPVFITFKTKALEDIKFSTNFINLKFTKIPFGFRQIIISLQFAVSIALLFAAVIIYKQMVYTNNAKLGFNKEQLLVVRSPWGRDMYERYEKYKSAILQYPEVQSVSACENVPGNNLTNYTNARVSGKPEEEKINCAQIAVDYGLFETWQVEFLDGRDFSKEISTDAYEAVVINKAAADKLGLKDANGVEIDGLNNATNGQKIIGVVENIHFKSFKEEVMPIIFYLRNWCSGNISIRLSTEEITSTMKVLEEEWTKLFPDRIFDYTFVSESFNRFYFSEQRTEKIIMIFCSLAILISLIGLLSVIILIAQQRRKEIGIRKVLGASVPALVSNIAYEYVALVICAGLLAFPVAFYLVNKWLERFVYKIEINWGIYILSISIVLIISLVTISFQAIKSSRANPVESLRNE